jgi:hypothetical protein
MVNGYGDDHDARAVRLMRLYYEQHQSVSHVATAREGWLYTCLATLYR